MLNKSSTKNLKTSAMKHLLVITFLISNGFFQAIYAQAPEIQ